MAMWWRKRVSGDCVVREDFSEEVVFKLWPEWWAEARLEESEGRELHRVNSKYQDAKGCTDSAHLKSERRWKYYEKERGESSQRGKQDPNSLRLIEPG